MAPPPPRPRPPDKAPLEHKQRQPDGAESLASLLGFRYDSGCFLYAPCLSAAPNRPSGCAAATLTAMRTSVHRREGDRELRLMLIPKGIQKNRRRIWTKRCVFERMYHDILLDFRHRKRLVRFRSSSSTVLFPQLASFMDQLESSGLLKDQQADDIEVASAASRSKGGGDGTAVEAEQRLLGYLSQSPSWSKVLDTASGSVYYWNVATNEVVWEVPEGLDPEQLLPADEDQDAKDAAGAGRMSATTPSDGAAGGGATETGTVTRTGQDEEMEEGQLVSDPGHRINPGAEGSANPKGAVSAAAPAGGGGGSSGHGPVLSELLLAEPQSHLTAVLDSLLEDATEASRYFMQVPMTIAP